MVILKKFKTATGGSRFVILIGNLVIKFPRLKTFSKGRRQNSQEWADRKKSSYLAKLYFSFPLGLCNIMQRATPLSSGTLSTPIREYFKSKIDSKAELLFILEDSSVGNFGVVDNKLVKIDWGGLG